MSFKAKQGKKQEAAGTLMPISVGEEKDGPKSKGYLSLCSLFEGALAFFKVLVNLTLFAVVVMLLGLCTGIIGIIVIMPLLVVSYLVVRLLQLLTDGDAYYKAINVMASIRFLMFNCMMLLLGLIIGYYSNLPGIFKILKKQHIITVYYDQSIRHWIHITLLIIGLYVLSFVISSVVESLSPPMLWRYERGVNTIQAAGEIIQCLILWWATTLVLHRVLPTFKQHHLMGLPTHKWIRSSILVIIGIDTIAFSCYFVTYLLHLFYKSLPPTLNVKSTRYYWVEEILGRENAMYWADGLRKNIVFLFSSIYLFLSWYLYFRTHLNATEEGKKVVRYGTMAFVSILILALLWLIKSCILLKWKTNKVYAQLRPRLIENREELYFLGILGHHKFDILNIQGDSSLPPKPLGSTVSFPQHRNRRQKDPRNKKQCGMIAAWRKYINVYMSCRNFVSDKSAKLRKKIQNYDSGYQFNFNYLCKIAVRLVFPYKLIKKVRDDLYIWKAQTDMQQEVNMDGPEILCETLYDLQKMAQYFLRAQPTLSDDEYVPNMLNHLTTSAAEDECSLDLEDYFKQLIIGKKIGEVKGDSNNGSDSQEEHEWKWFKNLVDKQSRRLSSKGIKEACNSSSSKISEPTTSSSHEIIESRTSLSNETKESQKIQRETLKAWLENARGTCLEIANALSSAEEVVNCLNNIMSGLLIGATFIMWLLLTGLATTKILVLIASPLLAATFIFGDTCKSLFQGIIFAYVCNPFNVGDLVVIDEKMMVVKILGVWKTIFVEIGKADEVTYPNSELASKKVINYKSDFDWNDCLEFTLKSFQSGETRTLMEAIKKDLVADGTCSPNHISTEVLVVEEDVKVMVHLKYNIDNKHDTTLYERLQEKHYRRSLASMKIWDLLKKI